MGLEEIRRKVEETRKYLVPGSTSHRALTELLHALDCEGAGADEPPVEVDDGFVILPMGRYEALREAEEYLQETRFAPTDGEADADPNSLARRIVRQYNLIRDQAEEIDRLKADAKVRAEAAAPPGPGPTASEPRFHPVLDKHLQDLQAELGGIKERLDEGCGEFNKIKARLDAQDKAVGETLSTVFDRLGAMTSRLNRLDADVMPIRRIGPGTGPQDRQRDEATRDRLLQEIKRVGGGVESTRP